MTPPRPNSLWNFSKVGSCGDGVGRSRFSETVVMVWADQALQRLKADKQAQRDTMKSYDGAWRRKHRATPVHRVPQAPINLENIV